MSERITGDTNQITWLVAETFNKGVNQAFFLLGRSVLNIGAHITEKKNTRACSFDCVIAITLWLCYLTAFLEKKKAKKKKGKIFGSRRRMMMIY